MPIKKQLGKKLKQARIDAGLTQQQLAEKVGVPYQHIGRWERGEVHPTAEKLLMLSEALEIGVNELLDAGETKTTKYLVSEEELKEKVRLMIQEELDKRFPPDKK